MYREVRYYDYVLRSEQAWADELFNNWRLYKDDEYPSQQ